MKAFAADAWLSETLGRPAFKWNGTDGDPAPEMAELSSDGDAFFFARVPTADVRSCSRLTEAGFRVVDTNVTFAWTGRHAGPSSEATVAIARPNQFEAVQNIAGTCFRWSRFHLDPLMPGELADRIKRRWIENYCNGARGSALYTAEVDGKTAGFLAVLESGGNAIIDLIAVADDAQGKGVGMALTEHFIDEWKSRASELRVGTQAANIRSLRLYERAGFSIIETAYVLHAHYHRGQPRT